jgi:large subunit ribosomal protein L24
MARRKTLEKPLRIQLRKEDMVEVIAGRDRGKRGRVLKVDRHRGRVLVEGIMLVKKHARRNPARGIKGGIAERESPIHVSNVMIVCSSCGPTRIGHKVEMAGGKSRRRRICRQCGAPLDKRA